MALDPARKRRALALGTALALLAATLTTAVASADQLPPAPQGDDVAFVQLGAVGEFVALEFFRGAARSQQLDGGERQLFRRLAEQKAKVWKRLGGLLGEQAFDDDTFAVRIPASVLRSRTATLALAARFERLLSGLYLGGVESAVDPPTRLLVGRQLAASARNLTLIRGLRGAHPSFRPVKPLSVEYVGIQLDRYLGLPGA